jgi:uncharacterized protein (DUF305 family)
VRNRRVALVGVIVAVLAAVVGIALAVAAITRGSGGSGVGPAPSTSGETVAAVDFCYVEAMIYYRVEAVDLAKAVLGKTGISAQTQAFARDVVAEQTKELASLRPWYVSWLGARPLERPDEGPCAGHGGTTHATMPGLPTPAQWDDFTAANGAEAEKMYLELLKAQNTAMIAFVDLVLASGANDRVEASAHEVIAQAKIDNAKLEYLLAGIT